MIWKHTFSGVLSLFYVFVFVFVKVTFWAVGWTAVLLSSCSPYQNIWWLTEFMFQNVNLMSAFSDDLSGCPPTVCMPETMQASVNVN